MFMTVITSAEFWLAVVALLQTVLLNYLGVPQDIWQAVNAILLVLIGALTADRVSSNIVRGMRETIVELRKMDKE
jgi:hypothetical protein